MYISQILSIILSYVSRDGRETYRRLCWKQLRRVVNDLYRLLCERRLKRRRASFCSHGGRAWPRCISSDRPRRLTRYIAAELLKPEAERCTTERLSAFRAWGASIIGMTRLSMSAFSSEPERGSSFPDEMLKRKSRRMHCATYMLRAAGDFQRPVGGEGSACGSGSEAGYGSMYAARQHPHRVPGLVT